MRERVRFEHPPVVEVACGISFAAPPGFRTAHVGLFWNEVRPSFPNIEEAVPLPSSGEAPLGIMELSFDGFPIPRTWMVCADGSALIQLQRDRLIYNWKANSDPYPSYDVVIVQFEKHLFTFEHFLKREGIGTIKPHQMELTYVNHIPLSLLADDSQLLLDHVRHGAPDQRFLPAPERFFWSTIYALPNEAGELQVLAQQVRSSLGGEDIIRLDMSARGFPVGKMNQRVWFDLAHDWITKVLPISPGRRHNRRFGVEHHECRRAKHEKSRLLHRRSIWAEHCGN